MNTQLQKGVSMPLVIGLILAGLVIVGVFALSGSPPQEQQEEDTAEEKDLAMQMSEGTPTQDAMMKDMTDAMMADMVAMVYQYSGSLSDVTDGATIRGINTEGNSSGIAQANFKDGIYNLLATFEDLPDPQGSDFYEGWIVRRGADFDVISSGKIEKTDGVYTNMYTSGADLTDHDFYVLTIEPDDGDPAPADHIVEGVLSSSGDAMMEKSETKVFNLTGQNFSFSQAEIRVKKGDTVRINFESADGFHDWTVGEFNAKTDRVNTGGTASIEFVADKTGTFEYYCSVGNHRLLGMKGNLIVE